MRSFSSAGPRFEGIRNFRDYGGQSLSGGGRVRRGRLYRSAGRHEATEADLLALGDLGVEAVIDLRGGAERARHSGLAPAAFTPRIYAVEEETGGLLGPLVAAAQGRPGGFDSRWLMREGYATMPFRWRLRGVMRLYFKALADTEGPSLVHCHAGKDRTGLAVALLLAALGVHRDDVIADYLRTNESVDLDARFATDADDLRRNFGDDLSPEQMRDLIGVRAEYIEASFGAIEARFSDVPTYLSGFLGVPDGELEAIATRLTEP